MNSRAGHSLSSWTRKAGRVSFYTRGILRELIPHTLYEKRRKAIFARLDRHLDADLVDRVGYYNAMLPAPVSTAARRLDGITMERSYQAFDLKEFTNFYPASLRIDYLFGDIRTVPEHAAIVKSRPLGDDNANSVVMKLGKLRHYAWWKDRLAFRDKRKLAVWRGRNPQPSRRALVEKFGNHPRFDIGFIGRIPGAKPYLEPVEQMRNRYIISVEGNDVATNLKWIFASNSLCLMPAPIFETWFMEGRLVAGVHYVEIRSDFADLEEKIDHYDCHEDEALAIIAAANAHFRQFLDRPREDLISLLVLQKYFERTGQIPPAPFSASVFGDGPDV